MAHHPELPLVDTLPELVILKFPEIEAGLYQDDDLLRGIPKMESLERANPALLFEHAIQPVYPGAMWEIASAADAIATLKMPVGIKFDHDTLLERLLASFEEFMFDYHGRLDFAAQVAKTQEFGRLAVCLARQDTPPNEGLSRVS